MQARALTLYLNLKDIVNFMTEEFKAISQSCGRCQVGQKHLRLVTFITSIGEEMITVPDFPAWVCDICGHRHYDNHALAQLALVLNSQAGQPVNYPYPQPPKGISSSPTPPTSS